MGIHKIERAKSGRSACRECRQKIAKGEARFGHAHPQENAEYSYRWYHLNCAADTRFLELEEALTECDLALPDIAQLTGKIATMKQGLPKYSYPRAVDGPDQDAYLCSHCRGWSFPESVRVVVPKQVQIRDRQFVRESTIHPSCVNACLGDANLLTTIIQNSGRLAPHSLEWLQDSVT